MSTLHIQYKPKLIPELIRMPGFGNALYLLDVGASGGVEQHWDFFGDKLKAIGFDPLVNEVDRLNREEARPNIKYEAGFVGCSPEKEPPALKTHADCVAHKYMINSPRSSAARANAIMRTNPVKEIFNSKQDLVHSDRKIVLDDFIPPSDYAQIDFIKVDTDGHDYPVLRGAERILKEGQVLGLSIEAQFQGIIGEKGNLFANIDTYLRNLGFSLFDLDVWRYSRAQLPMQFYYELNGQTTHGQAIWGEAVYFRDIGCAEYEEMWGFVPSEEKILKLMGLFELFGLSDCSAEMLLKYKDRLSCGHQADRLLDLLTPKLHGEQRSYKDHMQAFNADPTTFYPKKPAPAAPAPWSASPATPSVANVPPTGPEYHSSGRPRSKPSFWSSRGIRRFLRGLLGESK